MTDLRAPIGSDRAVKLHLTPICRFKRSDDSVSVDWRLIDFAEESHIPRAVSSTCKFGHRKRREVLTTPISVVSQDTRMLVIWPALGGLRKGALCGRGAA